MSTRAHPRRRSSWALLPVVLAAVLTSACSQPEPDEGQVARAVGRLPGVVAVDASFTGTSLGNSGDQSIKVTTALSRDPSFADDLVRDLPKTVNGVEHGDGYREFTLVEEMAGEDRSRPITSTFTFGREPVPQGLATRWASVLTTRTTGGVQVRAWPAPRPPTASISSSDPVSTSVAWALDSDLRELDWSFVDYATTDSPYVRFFPGRAITAAMVTEWQATDAAYAAALGEPSIARAVVVEDIEGVRRVQLTISVDEARAEIPEATYGPQVWPIATAIDAGLPEGHRLRLRLNAKGAGNDGLVDNGKGAADWEAAYRQRFPDAVPVSAPPT